MTASGAPCVIVGAGPGGLTAAYELAKHGLPAVVYEKDQMVGGISRTAVYEGYRFDIGGHRFFSKVPLIEELWTEILGDDMLIRRRLSRIYYGGKFFDYPLKPVNALLGLGPIEAVRVGLSYLRARLFPHSEERNFEEWVSNRFGRRLYEIFFKTYTEKVWGMPCSEISADWAAQRIKNLDLVKAVKNALLGAAGNREVITTLIDQFRYPRHGPGMMWERCRDLLARRGVETQCGATVTRIRRDGNRVTSVEVRRGDGSSETTEEVEAAQVLSTMPLGGLVRALDPPPPEEVLAAARRLRHRDFLTVVLIVDEAELFPDNWIYIHSSEVRVGRVQNFKNWSPEMVPDPAKTAVGLEYFVRENDDLWSAADEDLVALGTREMATLGLIDPGDVEGGTVVRMPKAYPVYDGDYQDAVATVREFIDRIENLQTVGRNGQHRYNNQDHSMLTGIYAARNIAAGAGATASAESYDVWDVNVEQEYHEEVARDRAAAGDRLVPAPAAGPSLGDLVRQAFAPYDAVAMGVAVGAVMAAGLALATIVLLFGGEPYGPNLSLLGNYFLGYHVSWGGLVIGTLEAALAGFGLGWAIARVINLLVRGYELSVRRQLQLAEVFDPLVVE